VRIAVVDTTYPAFLAERYAADPQLARRPYDDQLASLLAAGFGTSDAYSTHLRTLGHETIDVIANADVLQLRWAREHGVAGALRGLALRLPGARGDAVRRRFRIEVLEQQLDAFAPDVVYLQDLWLLDRAALDRQRGRGRLVAGQIASTPPDAEVLRGFDLLLTSFPQFVDRFRALGVDSEYLRIAFHTDVLRRLRAERIEPDPHAERPIDVAFVGGLSPRVHGEGVRLLERVCAACDVDVWGWGADELPANSPIRRRYRGEAWGLEMYRVLARSRIALNRHIAAAEGHANNMRLYEATGVGAMLLTDAGSNLDELFAPRREVAVYDHADDVIQQIQHYLAHDDERVAVATAGQARTLSEHTYEQRMRELAAILEARLR
jgi:hypothetical protein